MQAFKHKTKNTLALYRRRIGYSQKLVARLLGNRDATLLCTYERGRVLPSLSAALRLSIIYRVPVEFLFPSMYEDLRDQIRIQEESLPARRLHPNH